MPHILGNDAVVSVICGLVVAFYAARRYDTPDTNRHTTTRMMFYMSEAGYVLASLVLFMVLAWAIRDPSVLALLGLANLDGHYSPPVLATLVLTTLLPNVTLLRTGNSWLLGRFQAWGRIPHGASNLADKLQSELLSLSPGALNAVEDWIARSPNVPSDLANHVANASSDRSAAMLARVLLLHRELSSLATQPEYSQAFRAQDKAWQALEKDLRVFAAQSLAFFVLFDHLTATGSREACARARTQYEAICQNVYRTETELLAVLLLRVEGSDVRIMWRLRRIGFNADAPCPPVSVGPFVFVGCMLTILVLFVVSAVPQSASGLPLPVLALLIGLAQTIGLVLAVVPKLRIAWFRPNSSGHLPYLGWIVSALAAGSIGFLLSRCAIAVTHHGIAAAWDFAAWPVAPTGPMTAAIALSTAIICDLKVAFARPGIRRLVEES